MCPVGPRTGNRMNRAPRDYFRYFSPHAEAPAWGLQLTAAGWSRIPRGAAYPPVRHPADHHFTWEHGRVLECLQIVLVTDGRGELHTRGGPPLEIGPGAAFVVLPRVWHRYRPDPATGWTESWIEVQGAVVSTLLRAGVFSVDSMLRPRALAAGLAEALEAVHLRARLAGPGFDAELSARAYAVLAAWARIGDGAPPTPLQRALRAAEAHLAENYAAAPRIEDLARELGVGYSHFRREFRRHTGFAPWEYVIRLRLAHARRLLASSHATLAEIAEAVGFSSAYHFSAAFKKAHAVAPGAWRNRMRAPPSPPR